MSEYTLYQGDCLEYMRGMDNGSVDAVITDPPYNSKLNYGTYNDNRPYDEYWNWIVNIVSECCRVARLVIVKHSALKIYDWTKHIEKSRMIVWYKPFSSGFKINGFATHFEPLWIVQGESKHWSKDVIEHSAGNGNHEENTGHPAQMPEGFVSKLLAITTDKGDTIFDPFMGSGTTGVTCMQLGRNFIGCEIDAGYFAIAEKRISEAAAQPPLFHLDAPKIEYAQAAFA
jgi:site-specific DNA-methyltransferase (adenine-specific)